MELFLLRTDIIVMENLTDWLRKLVTANDTDTISTYNGFVLRRLNEGNGLLVTISKGIMTVR